MARRLGIIAVGFVVVAILARGTAVAGVEDGYEKTERMVPMRDGTRLFTSVYAPKDRSKAYPVLLERTPYGVGPYGARGFRPDVGPSGLFAEAGYIVAYQDVRGCFMSEGTFEDVRPGRRDRADPKAFDESTDAYDTIEWLIRNVPNNNGKVGMWGISYPAFYAAAALVDSHPALKAVSPQAPLVDWFLGDDTHHNGAFFLTQEFNFDAFFGVERPMPTTQHGESFDHGTPDGYEFFLRMGPIRRADELYFKGTRRFWSQVMAHGTYDEFWRERALLPRIKSVAPAVLTVGGWYDAEDLYGPLRTYRRIEQVSPKSNNRLVMGPWAHGGWAGGTGSSLGPFRFGGRTAEHYREAIELPFFEHHLKGIGDGRLPKVAAFETGRNAWREFDRWPPKEVVPTALHLRENGGLDRAEAKSHGYDAFVSDPAKPVPYTSVISTTVPTTYMIEDQRFAARRTDVLVHRTEPLAEDLTVAGPIRAELVVSTTGTDADWVVKLIDELPDDERTPEGLRLGGHQRLVRADVMRGKFRESFGNPKPFEPGVPTSVAFELQDAFHTFKRGHRIMVQIQSSWFPLVDRNPQTYIDIYRASESDFRKAEHRVHRGPGLSSRVVLPVLPPDRR